MAREMVRKMGREIVLITNSIICSLSEVWMNIWPDNKTDITWETLQATVVGVYSIGIAREARPIYDLGFEFSPVESSLLL